MELAGPTFVHPAKCKQKGLHNTVRAVVLCVICTRTKIASQLSVILHSQIVFCTTQVMQYAVLHTCVLVKEMFVHYCIFYTEQVCECEIRGLHPTQIKTS